MYRCKNTSQDSFTVFTVFFVDGESEPIVLGPDHFDSVLHLLDGALLPWTRLEFRQCSCCPLDASRVYHCPAALSVASLLREFDGHFSHEQVKVSACDHVGRHIEWGSDLQNAVHLLARMALFASGCPVTERLRPFVASLSPLATHTELSEHLALKFLAVFGQQDARRELSERLSGLHSTVRSVCDRLRSGMHGDAVPNALIIIIDTLATLLEFTFDEVVQKMGFGKGTMHREPEQNDAGNRECAEGLKVLLAEDDAEMRDLLTLALRGAGLQVCECSDGAELLTQLDPIVSGVGKVEWDLVISDNRMPGVLGLEIFAGLRRLADAPPLILITAFGDTETHALARELGVAAVFDKPFDIDDLLKEVQLSLAYATRE